MEQFVWCFCLVLARVGSFITVLPLFGTLGMPRLVKAGLVLALTMVWYVPLAEAMPTPLLFGSSDSLPLCAHVAAIVREMLLGGILGFGLGLFLVPIHVAGEFLTQEMGLAFANQVNPTTGSSTSPMTSLLEYLAIAIFFGVDGHHVFLGVLDASFTQYPLSSAMPSLPITRLVAGAAMAEEWGLMLAGPVALCLLLTTVVLAVLAKAAPQLNMYAVGFPLRIVVGLAAAVLLLPTWVGAVVSGFSHFAELAGQWM